MASESFFKVIKDHQVKKDDSMKEKLKELSGNPVQLEEDFGKMENFVKTTMNFSMKETTGDELVNHNRSNKAVPFDKNRITLSTTRGTPPTNYINASPLSFPSHAYSYIGTQAPTLSSINNFWQMVREQQVRVIVMVTGLVEKGQAKADVYWPMNKDEGLVLEDGSKVILENVKDIPDMYTSRSFKMNPSGEEEPFVVDQIHVENWPDMGAPGSSKFLIDLVEEVRNTYNIHNRGPILVHCGSGVGRTGTFIAGFKLYEDVLNKEVHTLDFMGTLVAMRSQRISMMKKKQQYSYVVKCISDFASSN